MTVIDLSYFEKSDPCVSKLDADFNNIKYRELFYDSRLKFLLARTKHVGKSLDKDLFNDLLNGRHSLKHVISVLENL